jgi:hypothetical protein
LLSASTAENLARLHHRSTSIAVHVASPVELTTKQFQHSYKNTEKIYARFLFPRRLRLFARKRKGHPATWVTFSSRENSSNGRQSPSKLSAEIL